MHAADPSQLLHRRVNLFMHVGVRNLHARTSPPPPPPSSGEGIMYTRDNNNNHVIPPSIPSVIFERIRLRGPRKQMDCTNIVSLVVVIPLHLTATWYCAACCVSRDGCAHCAQRRRRAPAKDFADPNNSRAFLSTPTQRTSLVRLTIISPVTR